MKLYVTRHGETTWNAANKVCGRTDVDLTERGREQARALGEKLRREGVKIDRIVASPLKRAVETAQLIAGQIGEPPLSVDERLIEQEYGVYEGKDRKDPGFLANKRQFAFRYPGGESMMQLAHRLYSLLEELREGYPEETVLLVCHNGVCRVLNTYFRDVTNEKFFHYELPNCGLEEYWL